MYGGTSPASCGKTDIERPVIGLLPRQELKMLFLRVPLMATSSSPKLNIFLMANPIYFATKEFYMHPYYT